jgi:hypothetical protein
MSGVGLGLGLYLTERLNDFRIAILPSLMLAKSRLRTGTSWPETS